MRYEPKVNASKEFKEIAFDFAKPLELVREAISNAFDAHAKNIKIGFEIFNDYGTDILKIILEDDGNGMDEEGMFAFFDLGNSINGKSKNAEGKKDTIGEKGHGTKVYFNSSKIYLETKQDGHLIRATMNEPYKNLFNDIIPIVDYETVDSEGNNYTHIEVFGFNNNSFEKFTHKNIKDYIYWFTKFGSIEKEFGIKDNIDVKLQLKGLDCNTYEELSFGHVFPDESKSVSALFDDYMTDASNYYCAKKIIEGTLTRFPHISYQAIFCLEGNKVKYLYNEMLSRRGYSAPRGAYSVQDRYGLWLCKDFIPIQRKNEWIVEKGTEYTRFHAFINCQNLQLTANRGSVENTKAAILEDLEEVARNIYMSFTTGDAWKDLEWLDSEAEAYKTDESEKKDFEWRIKRINSTKIAKVGDNVLVEPQSEGAVFSLFIQLMGINKDLFPFTIIDYNTHKGIDIIVKGKDDCPIKHSKLFYVEMKYYLDKKFNHTFRNLKAIICWDISTNLKNNEEITDLTGETRTLEIVQPENASDYTRYYLVQKRSDKKIEIFVLRLYLEEKMDIRFYSRPEDSCF
ncbi:putative uncharacterized protein [Acidaminococcus sp. CAG:917]|nr:putative uncharacterized protein [Acidaminococcus sp. CAG:917]